VTEQGSNPNRARFQRLKEIISILEGFISSPFVFLLSMKILAQPVIWINRFNLLYSFTLVPLEAAEAELKYNLIKDDKGQINSTFNNCLEQKRLVRFLLLTG